MRRGWVRFALLGLMCFLACGGNHGDSLPSPVSHGDWVSSGGERFKDANNPWWVKNTERVRYCIQIDEQSISASKETIHAKVREAFAFWKREIVRESHFLNEPLVSVGPNNQIGVAVQTIEPGECDGGEDLRLQFGYGTLTEEQKAFLRDPYHYIGISVRTSYDEARLHGKGFVFIGSDIGPHRFAPDTQAEKVWKSNFVLWLAITHELGHVFGLPHVGKSRYALMGSDFLELATSQQAFPFFAMPEAEASGSFEGFFVPKNLWKGTLDDDLAKTYFGLGKDHDSVSFELNPTTREVEIRSYPSGSRDTKRVGKLDSLDIKMDFWPMSGIILMLNPVQKIFFEEGKPPLWLMLGPQFVAGSGGARLVLDSGESRPVHLHVGPDGFQLSSIVEGVDRTVVNFLQ